MAYDAQFLAEALNYKTGDITAFPSVGNRKYQITIPAKHWPDYYKGYMVWIDQAQNPVDDVKTYRLISNRAHMPNTGVSSGSNRNVVYRTAHFSSTRAAITDMRLVFANSYLDATGEHNGSNTIFVTASVEYGGTNWAVTFSSALESNIPAGTTRLSDIVSVNIPAGAQFWTRQNVRTANAAETFRTGYPIRTDLGEDSSVTNAAAQVSGTGPLTSGTAPGNVFAPSAILGASIEGRPPSVVIVGASSAYGQGETLASIASPASYGYLARMLSNNIGHTVLAAGSETLAQWQSASTIRMAHLNTCVPTHVINQLGSNDIQGGATSATVQSRLQAVWANMAASGRRVIQCTFTPTATGTFATVAGQTSTFNAVRIAVNDYIRTCPAPLAGYIDVCAVTESSPNSGVWRVDGGAWTSDGVHTIRHADVAAALSSTGIIA